MKPLEYYLLSYVIDDPDDCLYWRCQAEDYEHAVEQLINAEPDSVRHELICSGELAANF